MTCLARQTEVNAWGHAFAIYDFRFTIYDLDVSALARGSGAEALVMGKIMGECYEESVRNDAMPDCLFSFIHRNAWGIRLPCTMIHGKLCGIAKSLTELVANSPAFAGEMGRLRSEGTKERPVVFPAVCPAAYSFVAAMVAEAVDRERRVWVVADSLPTQERVAAEFPIWSHLPAVMIPEQDWNINRSVADPDSTAERLEALYRVTRGAREECRVALVTAAGLQESVPRFEEHEARVLRLHCGMRSLPPEKLIERLKKSGFERTDQVTSRNQWSMRGGIMDVFPLQTAWPLRIEYFGDEVESIRAFDVDSQLSFRKLDTVDLMLEEPKSEMTLRDLISERDCVVSLPGCGVPGDVLLYETPPDADGSLITAERPADSDALSLFPTPLGSFDTGDFVMQEARRQYARASLQQRRKEKWRLVMYFAHESEKKRFEEICAGDTAWDAVQARIGALPFGFTVPSAKLAVLSAAEIFGRHLSPRVQRRRAREERIRASQSQTPLHEIQPGDLVVHAAHGIGSFIGIVRHEETGEEELHIRYAGGVLLRIPLSQSYLVSKYVGLGTKTPELNKLGDSRWKRACRAAQNAVADYAAQLLEVQAQRESNKAEPHPPDSSWMWQFEASFPFRETPDQLTAIRATKEDMESTRPMDRLICGDVGFGKTEVALRAAFKCVTGGRQAALLAPTTVLANQHYHTFRERMSEYPIRIEMLSRFTPTKRVKDILTGIQNGDVDIVIGTHRLLSKDVSFHNLGLVVIDEEQRFGVRHKEQFKRSFRMVDMLTLSATPIPRTLYVALMGARDMSTINTPPPNRLSVQTIVCPYNEEVIAQAIERELARKGQIFFLHNRVQGIESMALILQKLAPKARIAIAHGQMDKMDLECIMRDFVDGKTDILLSTTIIESGIDIPNANTIIINRADRFGLADLYQLRGRVGRSNQKAYAYLLLPEEALCTGDARRRVSAIRQYTELGSGFKIAMRDLEIRGAGNLLGTQQSGHIAAIGFELYCQLLRQSIDSLRGVAPTRRPDVQVKADFLCLSESIYTTQTQNFFQAGAFIPSSYVPSTRGRMEGYTLLAQANSAESLDELSRQWTDRYGSLPQEARNLLLLQRIKICAAAHQISSVEVRGSRLMLTRNGDFILFNRRFPHLKQKKPEEKLIEIIRLLSEI